MSIVKKAILGAVAALSLLGPVAALPHVHADPPYAYSKPPHQ